MKMITRKQILQYCPSLTYDILQENEKSLGLLPCRVKINQRLILYKEVEAKKILTALGFWQ